jgi:diacylglycerol kinase family enzyme
LELLADGQKIAHRTPFLFVGNNRYEVEGVEIGTRQRLDAGVLGVCASNAPGRWALISLAARAVLRRIQGDADFLNIAVKELVVKSRHRTLQLSLDGELLRLHTPLRFEIRPGALRVMAPGGKS